VSTSNGRGGGRSLAWIMVNMSSNIMGGGCCPVAFRCFHDQAALSPCSQETRRLVNFQVG
jgi:hypothetical protein